MNMIRFWIMVHSDDLKKIKDEGLKKIKDEDLKKDIF